MYVNHIIIIRGRPVRAPGTGEARCDMIGTGLMGLRNGIFVVLYFGFRGESNRQNESHDDPMNKRLAAWGGGWRSEVSEAGEMVYCICVFS